MVHLGSSRILEFQNSRIRNSGIRGPGFSGNGQFEGRLRVPTSAFKIVHLGSFRIPEFHNPEFWDPGVLDFLEMDLQLELGF